MFRKLAIPSTFRSSTSSGNRVKYRKNHGVVRKDGRKRGVLHNADDDDEEDDDLGPNALDSFNGVKIIGIGHHGDHGSGGYHVSSGSNPSSAPPMNIMKIDAGQITYGSASKDSAGGPGSGKKCDQERNGPRVIPGIITSTGRGGDKVARVFSHHQSASLHDDQGDKSETKDQRDEDEGGEEKDETKPIITTISGSKNDEESVYLSRKRRENRKQEIKDLGKYENKYGPRSKNSMRYWSFVFDPSGRLCYYWSMIVSLAFLYNFWVIIYRFAFDEISSETVFFWLSLDIIADSFYILDILINFRICYLDEGVLQTNPYKLRIHYMNSTFFYIDCLCLLPLDFLYLSIGFNSILRSFRLVKIYKFWSFLDRTERHTNYPNVFRTISLIHYILVIFHWNACFYHLLEERRRSVSPNDWFIGSKDDNYCSDVECDYLHSFYWSILALTIIGDLPRPRTKPEYIFLIVELFLGLFLLATVLGHVANIVTHVGAARKEFQAKLDSVKTYMRMRRVPEHLKVKVIKWFDYLWMTQKSADEDKSVGSLPAKLKAEIAIHVHLDTLKRVEIFQNTEAGFLCALVLRLKPVLFSPGDYVCRKGEIGKEMYIVNRGKLQVVSDSGAHVLATLRAGSYFGEISILNMGAAGNRRTASVKSVGYSDLFCLSKQDLWDVLKDYPAARVRLEAIASKRLEKYRREPLLKISRGRSKSTPGLQIKPTSGLSRFPDGKNYRAHTQSANTLITDEEILMMSGGDGGGGGAGGGGELGELREGHSGDGNIAENGFDRHEVDYDADGGQVDRTKDYFEKSLSSASTNATGTEPKDTLNISNDPNRKDQNKENINIYFTPPTPIPMPLIPSGEDFTERYKRVPEDFNQSLPSPTSMPFSRSPVHGHYHVPSSSSPTSYPFTCHLISPTHSSPHLYIPGQTLPLTPSALSRSIAMSPSPEDGGGQTQELLLAEIKRLRERLVHLEKENTSMSYKLSQQQWEVEERLKGIEMMMVASKEDESVNTGNREDNDDDDDMVPGEAALEFESSGDESERNKESII
ncbi:uncharacterized protein LOC141857935 [Brevipalpus obovatus]|uniref:uncharacterized protein LOC141857935 n=1 Tax=Brevipalpus obovatus TaxID=246614 RepID=UPI003D9F06C0